MWGISYPGFYVSAGMIDAHPALKAVSPQAPVTDYYMGDDSFHNGAFMLAANFGFYTGFPVRPKPERPQPRVPFDYGTPSGYEFFLQMGPLWSGAERYGVLDNPYYRGNLEHTTYDEFWKARAIWKHFKGITPAVLTVGGWFDAEDIAGPLLTYKTLKSDSPTTKNHLVMGPWTHGSWARGDGRVVGNLDFGAEVSAWYREHVEFPFFMQHLKDKTLEPVAEATMFETGTNRWRTFAAWPPQTTATPMYLGARSALSSAAPAEAEAFDQYLSDPNRPVPYVGHVQMGMQRDYMTEDQRFAATRPDVLVYMTPPLDEDLTVLGKIGVDLHVSTSGTDSDFVVKVIDVFPSDYPDAGVERPGAGAGQSRADGRLSATGARRTVPRQVQKELRGSRGIRAEPARSHSVRSARRGAHLPPRPPVDGADPELVVPAHRSQPSGVHRHPEGASRRFHHRHAEGVSQPAARVGDHTARRTALTAG